MRWLFYLGIIIAVSAMFLVSCYHLPSLPFEVLPKDSIVCFQNDVLPILQSNCGKSGCHAGGEGNGINFNTYEGTIKEVDVANPINSRLITAIYKRGSGKMPPPPNPELTQQQIDLIYIWIQQGAHNTNCTEVCDTANVTYSGSVKPILNTYCVGCHNGSTGGTNINLTTYSGTYQTVTSERLMGSIEQLTGYSAMPQGSKLSDCKISIIQKWINEGAPDN